MAAGGIYDHLGGGFARYSTDRRWLVPHFEKMLYDNALLARLYLHAWQLTGADRYRQVVDRDARLPPRPPDAPTRTAASPPPRTPTARGWRAGSTSGTRPRSARSAGRRRRRLVRGDRRWQLGGPLHPVPARSAATWSARPRSRRPGLALFARRSARVRPGLDDKVLTEWNAMAVAALAEAGAALGRPDWVDRRRRDRPSSCSGSLRRGGRPLAAAAWRTARSLAYAADHAWLVEAFTRLAEATGQARWIAEARAAADDLLRLFWDDEDGRLSTPPASDAEALIARPKDTYDGALPSANSVAAAGAGSAWAP